MRSVPPAVAGGTGPRLRVDPYPTPSFVFGSCDFVDRSFLSGKPGTIHEVTLTSTNQNTPAFELDPTFEAKLRLCKKRLAS